MNYVLLAIHVASAIVFIGGVTVSASVFPRYATGENAEAYADRGGHPAAIAMHRITKGYGRLTIITPIAGLALALLLGKLGDVWVLISIVLVVIGGVVLLLLIIPSQRRMLAGAIGGADERRRAVSFAGLLNLIWLAVLVLMITKPGGAG